MGGRPSASAHSHASGGVRPAPLRKALFVRRQTGYAYVMSTASGAPIPRSLFVFSLFYGGMVCIAGVLGGKQVALGPFAVEAGIFGFILLVVIASTIAELYGKET